MLSYVARSRQITHQMALRTSKSKALENTNDPYSNSKVAEMFEDIKNNIWVVIIDNLTEGDNAENELNVLELLADIVKVNLLF